LSGYYLKLAIEMETLAAADAAALLRNRTSSNGKAGAGWVRDLPRLITQAAKRWGLSLQPHYADLSYNYVAPVTRQDGTPAVLKLCFPDEDVRHEAAALHHFAGDSSVRLLESDLETGALLLERLEPGSDIRTLNDDVAEVATTAAVMRDLWRPPPAEHAFPTIADWIEEMARTAEKWGGKHAWLASAVDLGRELVSHPQSAPVLLHGDLHHYNVLQSLRGWLCIDPHGVIGEPAWEVGPYLYNHLPDAAGEAAWRQTVRRRADQFAEALAIDRRRIHACAAVYAAISSAWSLSDSESQAIWFAKHRAVMQELAGF
jgi:streptomycin 6-kinase